MTQKAFCKVTCMPVRQEASDASEMVSQLLLGEFVEVLEEEHHNWFKIKCVHDGYEGYVDPKQLQNIEDTVYDLYQKRKPQYTSKVFTPAYYQQKPTKIPLGGDVRFLGKKEGSAKIPAIDFAISYLGTPYLWGGRSPFGIDCSGLTQIIFAYRNVQLPRDASQQVHEGTDIAFDDQNRWDLVFFENASGKIIHVGIVLDNHDVLHAHGEVKISKLTPEGLLNDAGDGITHKYTSIKRFDFPKERKSVKRLKR